MSKTRPGVVSVILVNYRGADDTMTCLRSFADVAWPTQKLELIVVDNASGDGSASRIREAAPGVTVVESPTNVGFAGGCNLGAAKASGEILAFINNDARPAPHWISAAVEVLERELDVASVASKVLDWDGDNIDYVDGSLTWYGMGYKWECEKPDTGEYDVAQDVLFATGSAMFVRAEDYKAVGGFDDRYFMFYEDVDLGWRLNLLGRRVRYVPGSVAYHRHHASMKSYGPWLERFLLERNALVSLYKNFGEEWLARALPAALVLAVRRSVSRGGDDPGVLDLARAGTVTSPDAATVEVSKETVAVTYAIDSFLEMLPSLAADRRADAEGAGAHRPGPAPAVPQDAGAGLRRPPLPRRPRRPRRGVRDRGDVQLAPADRGDHRRDARPRWPAPPSGPGPWPTPCRSSTTWSWSRSAAAPSSTPG